MATLTICRVIIVPLDTIHVRTTQEDLYRVQHTGSHVKRLATKVDEFYKNKLEQAKMLSDDVGEAICNDFKSACYVSSYTISSKMMKESPAY